MSERSEGDHEGAGWVAARRRSPEPLRNSISQDRETPSHGCSGGSDPEEAADRRKDSDGEWTGSEMASAGARENQVQTDGLAHGVQYAGSAKGTTMSITPLAESSSFLTSILRTQWDLGLPEKLQYRGGWVVLPRRCTDPGLVAAAEGVEWPTPGGSGSTSPPHFQGSNSFAQAVMAGRGDWRGGPRGFGGGRGWSQPRPPQGDWNWRGQPSGNHFGGGQMGGAVGGGGAGQSFGYGGQAGQYEQRPQQGGFGQGEFYNYNSGFQVPPQPMQGMNSIPGNLPGNFGANVGRPVGGVEQQRGIPFSGASTSAYGSNAPVNQQNSIPAYTSAQQAPTPGAPATQVQNSGGGTGLGKAAVGLCYRCGEPGHGIKECKTVVLCEVCGKTTHITANCALPNQPKPVAALIGCGGEGLQMFTALTSRKVDPDKAKQAIALVTVHTGNINVQQLVDAFSRMFQWEWEWKARPYLANSFLVKFPSAQKIEEMKGYEYFGLSGLNAAVKVSKWDNAAMAKYKLYVVWVRITGIPESLLHYHGICEAASLIGKVKEVDMKLFRQSEIVRVKLGVKDPRKIPAAAPLNDDDYIYDIWFELEDIVEQGGPMLGGALVMNQVPDPTSGGFSGTSVGTSAGNTAPGAQNNNLPTNNATKETDNSSAVGEAVTLAAKGGINSSVQNPNDSVQVQQNDVGKEADGMQVSNAVSDFQGVMDNEEVISSQYELDKQWQEARNSRKGLGTLVDNVAQANNNVPAGIDKTNVDEDMAENVYAEEVDFDCSEDPDDFARRVGLSTQRIREIDKVVLEEVTDKENIAPVKGDVEMSQGVSVVARSNVEVAHNSFAEAQERIKKAKAKAEMDEAAVRRSVRNKKNEDLHAMERCEDMAKKKNLEAPQEKRTTKATTTRG